MKYIHLTFVTFFATSFLSFSSFSYDGIYDYFTKSCEISIDKKSFPDLRAPEIFELFKRQYNAGLTSTLDITGLPSESRIYLLQLIIKHTWTMKRNDASTTFMIGAYPYTINWKKRELTGLGSERPISTKKDLSFFAVRLTNLFELKKADWEKVNNKLVQQQKDGKPIVLEHENTTIKINGEKFLNGFNLFVDYKSAKICTSHSVLNKIKKIIKNEENKTKPIMPQRQIMKSPLKSF